MQIWLCAVVLADVIGEKYNTLYAFAGVTPPSTSIQGSTPWAVYEVLDELSIIIEIVTKVKNPKSYLIFMNFKQVKVLLFPHKAFANLQSS